MNILLIIEARRAIAAKIADLMKEELHSTVIAANGKQGLELLEHSEFHLVILDSALPDRSAVDLLQTIRADNACQQLPVVILSDTTDEQEIEKMLELGANDFISMPFSPLAFKVKIRNLLQLQQIHQELICNTKQLDEVFNNIPIISLLVDNDVKVQSINKSGQQVSSKPNAFGLLGGEVFNCIHAMAENATCGKTDHCKDCVIRNSVNSTIDQGEYIYKKEGEFTMVNGDKSIEMTILVSTSPIMFKNKQSVLLSIDDITNEKQALNDLNKHLEIELEINKQLNAQREELIQSENRYKYLSTQFEAILDHIPGLVFYKDKNNNYITVNKYVALAHGVEKDQLEGKNLSLLYPKEDADYYWQNDLEVINSDQAKLNFEEPWDTGTEKRWVNTSKIPFKDENGEILGVIGLAFDITEKKEYEKQIMLQNEQLHELNITKDKFFSIIAHDLKNPFNGILGFSEILVDNLADYELDQINEMVKLISESAQSAYALLENLLYWSKSQTGSIEYSPNEVDLQQLIVEVLDVIAAIRQAKNIAISYEMPESILILADRNMLSTILRNLLTNAIKFTPKSGAIKIVVAVDATTVQISVQDNGVGIEQDKMDKLFKINEKTSTAGTENEQGTGLGLILCKEFVEKHGGEIWVESEVGVGSEFKFTIPLPRG